MQQLINDILHDMSEVLSAKELYALQIVLQIITLERFLKITLIATSLPSPLLHRMLFIQVIQQLFHREVLLAWLVECLQNLNPWVENYI